MSLKDDRLVVLDALNIHGPLWFYEIAEKTGLDNPAIFNVLQMEVRTGHVERSPAGYRLTLEPGEMSGVHWAAAHKEE
jgi:DNA-binding IclR family transcriptional regulator